MTHLIGFQKNHEKLSQTRTEFYKVKARGKSATPGYLIKFKGNKKARQLSHQQLQPVHEPRFTGWCVQSRKLLNETPETLIQESEN